MPAISLLPGLEADMTAWRRHLHANPELEYDVVQTAAFVAERLRDFGCDQVVTGVGRTGVVGVIRGVAKGRSRSIGLRADMDALPIEEKTNLAYRSVHRGKMHACGHDGHSAMLLGAARHLAANRDFCGNVVLIFQPAEEAGAGAAAMIGDGLLARFAVEQVFGLHNMPGLAVGHFAIRSGAFMASTDLMTIRVDGKGGHAARPHLSRDPVLAAAHLVVALQSIVSRNIDPLDSAVVSICGFQAATAHNVIPDSVELRGTARSFSPNVRDKIEQRFRAVSAGIAAAMDVAIEVDYQRGYPVLVNDPAATDVAIRAAAEVSGAAGVENSAAPVMIAEDFAYMLEARPGAFIFMGNGASEGLHQAGYDFDDRAAIYGASYWINLVQTTLGNRGP